MAPNPEMRKGGRFDVRVAESIMVTRETKPGGRVVIMVDVLTNDLNDPVIQVAYMADPDQADLIAERLTQNAAAARKGQ